ncbi:MAG TPA: Ig-like domain-containing protein, partial [Kofleriaceae bacterium]|nr:Ig-like domain-containing protein [Kofleriaceae bacterium]
MLSLALCAPAACKPVTPVTGADAGGDGDADAGAGEAPRVLATTPAADEPAAAPDGAIQVVFSVDMDPDSLDADSLQVVVDGAPVTGQIAYDAASHTATVTPDRRLALLGHGQATVTLAATSAEGVPMAAGHTWTFTVRDGVWAGATEIEPGGGDYSQKPRIAVAATGDALAVWEHWDGIVDSVWAAHASGATWDAGALLEQEDGSAVDPSVA